MYLNVNMLGGSRTKHSLHALLLLFRSELTTAAHSQQCPPFMQAASKICSCSLCMHMLTLLLALTPRALPGNCPESCCHALTHRQLCLKASYYTESMRMRWRFLSSHHNTQNRTAGDLREIETFLLFLPFLFLDWGGLFCRCMLS